jgi:protein-L-isoaspartate(D-aspartate) O-methyltransferase
MADRKRDAELANIRRDYARRMLERAGVTSPALENAYAAVPREDFVGPGPWSMFDASGYRTSEDDNPARLYEDVLVALVPEKRINNGQPSGHAAWLAAADPRPGDHAVHIGAGTGYYTAILAELVGPTGRVTAIEYDATLAERAAQNLARYACVHVIHGDAFTERFDPADVIYVNAGASRPANSWLHGLKQGGRLVIPLTAIPTDGGGSAGAMFRFTREGDEFRITLISAAAFIRCEGASDTGADNALSAAFNAGGARDVTRLVPGNDRPDDKVWLRWPGWTLLRD